MGAGRCRAYAQGELDTMAELDEPCLDATRRGGMQFYSVYVSPKL